MSGSRYWSPPPSDSWVWMHGEYVSVDRPVGIQDNDMTTNLQHRPWYVVPDYQPPGRAGRSLTGTIVNARGEYVAHFESIEEARDVIELVNGEQA